MKHSGPIQFWQMPGCHLHRYQYQVKKMILVNKAHLASQPSKLCDQWLGLVKLKRPSRHLIFRRPCFWMTKVATGDDHCGLVNLHKSIKVIIKALAANSIQSKQDLTWYEIWVHDKAKSTWIAQWSQSGGLKGKASTLASPLTGRSSVVFGEKNPPVNSRCFPNTVLVWLYLKNGVNIKT